jgi:hypothetical protein
MAMWDVWIVAAAVVALGLAVTAASIRRWLHGE